MLTCANKLLETCTNMICTIVFYSGDAIKGSFLEVKISSRENWPTNRKPDQMGNGSLSKAI